MAFFNTSDLNPRYDNIEYLMFFLLGRHHDNSIEMVLSLVFVNYLQPIEKTLSAKRYKPWTIRPNSFLGSVWPMSLFAFFSLENKSTCGFQALKFTYLKQKTRNTCLLIARTTHNSIRPYRLWFKLCMDRMCRCLQPIPRDPKDNGAAAMLDDRTFCFVIQHGRHAVVFLDLQRLVANHLYCMKRYVSIARGRGITYADTNTFLCFAIAISYFFSLTHS